MIADALSLVRTCAETAFVMGWAATDDKVVDALIEDRDKHRLTSANAYLNDSENSQVATNEQTSKLQQVVAEVKGQYQEQGPHHIIWAEAAKKADMSAIYDFIYRTTSGTAAHTTLDALDRHVQPDNQGKIERLTFRPETRDLRHTLSVAANSLSHVMVGMNRLCRSKELERALQFYLERYASLVSGP